MIFILLIKLLQNIVLFQIIYTILTIYQQSHLFYSICVMILIKWKTIHYLFRVPARMVVHRPTPINQLFNDESIAVQIWFLDVYTWK